MSAVLRRICYVQVLKKIISCRQICRSPFTKNGKTTFEFAKALRSLKYVRQKLNQIKIAKCQTLLALDCKGSFMKTFKTFKHFVNRGTNKNGASKIILF